VTIEEYGAQRVAVRCELEAPGYLVLSDTHYPGWVARVDGVEQEVLKANYLFRAVRLSAGAHRVELAYEPASFTIGAALSGATAVLLLALPVIARRRDRRRRRAPATPSR
jgi:uncharacterized membrane protein YfhO